MTLPLNFPFLMAPMVGLSHAAFRQLIQEYLPKDAQTIWPTEMLSSRRIPHQKLENHPMTLKSPFDQHLSPQILGNKEENIVPTVEKLESWGASSIDINMGCAESHILKHNYGVSLMGDINYAANVVKITRKATNLPVTVKLRSGLKRDLNKLIEFCQALEQAGANWLTIHPRIASEKRRALPDWQQIKELKKHISIPIIGNGDVQTFDEALDYLKNYHADAIMIGRALTARPWLFWQLGEKLGHAPPQGKEHSPCPFTPREEALEMGKSLLRYLDLCFFYFTEQQALKRFRFHLRHAHGWLNFGHRLTSLAHKGKNYGEIKEKLENFFKSSDLKMYPKTQLKI